MPHLTDVMTIENQATAGAEPVDATKNADVVDGDEDVGQETDPGTEGEKKEGDGKKPELTAEQKEIYALKRRIGRMTKEKTSDKAELAVLRRDLEQLQNPPEEGDRPQLTEQEIERRAQALARKMADGNRVEERITSSIAAGRKELGKGFNALVATVDDLIGGFFDGDNLRDIGESIFDADRPHQVIRYLADNPEFAAELSDMPAKQQVKRITRLEIELEKASTKKPSNAPKPIDEIKASSVAARDETKMTDKEFWDARQKARMAG